MLKASLQTSDQKDNQINYLQQQLLSTRQVNIFIYSNISNSVNCKTIHTLFLFCFKALQNKIFF